MTNAGNKPTTRCNLIQKHYRVLINTVKCFMCKKKKVVPDNIIRFLQDPLALAVWYLDDGALRTDSRAFRFHTNSYSLHDVQLLRSALKENFNIVSGIHTQQNKKQTPATHDVMGAAHIARVECSQGLLEQPPGADVQEKQYILHIGASDGQAQGFCNLVKPLVEDQVPTMLYKFF